jgi:Zn finger protein HypA/HybF involved in hydrogenase expression
MKCRVCDRRIQAKTYKKNLGKCSQCKALEKKIAKDVRQWLEING